MKGDLVMDRERVRVLCICAKGKNRSRYLANYLKMKGYSTRFGRIDENGQVYEKIEKEVSAEDVIWADVIIVVRKRLISIFKEKFGEVNKKMISLDVSDSIDLVPQEYSYLKNLDYHSFQLRWTYPRLREAIKNYLPLEKDG